MKKINVLVLASLVAALIIFFSYYFSTDGFTQVNTDRIEEKFTYATEKGGVWQVDILGQRQRLLPDDSIEKWQLIWSPSGQWLGYIEREPTLDNNSLLFQDTLILLNAETKKQRTLAGPINSIYFQWLDDNQIKYGLAEEPSDGSKRQEWVEYIFNIETEEQTQIEPKSFDPIPSPVFSPDSQWVYNPDQQKGIKSAQLINVRDDQVHTVYRKPISETWAIKWSPDSKYVLYYEVNTTFTDIYLYNLTTKQQQNLTNFSQKGRANYLNIYLISWSPTSEWVLFFRDTNTHHKQPCLVSITDEKFHCFDISISLSNPIWSMKGRYLGFITHLGENSTRDIYAIDIVEQKLVNLTQDGSESIETTIAY